MFYILSMTNEICGHIELSLENKKKKNIKNKHTPLNMLQLSAQKFLYNWAKQLKLDLLTLSSIYTHLIEKKASSSKTLCKKVKLLKMSNFPFFHNISMQSVF